MKPPVTNKAMKKVLLLLNELVAEAALQQTASSSEILDLASATSFFLPLAFLQQYYLQVHLFHLVAHQFIKVDFCNFLVVDQDQHFFPSDHQLSLSRGLHYEVCQRVQGCVCWEQAIELALRRHLASLTVAPELTHR